MVDLPTYEDFLEFGELIGQGSCKKVYKISGLVMAVPKNNKVDTSQFYEQYKFFEKYKYNEEVSNYLNPVIKFSEEPLYMISPYCRPLDTYDDYFDDYDISRFQELTGNYLDETDLNIENQAIDDRELPVFIDYGLVNTNQTNTDS